MAMCVIGPEIEIYDAFWPSLLTFVPQHRVPMGVLGFWQRRESSPPKWNSNFSKFNDEKTAIVAFGMSPRNFEVK